MMMTVFWYFYDQNALENLPTTTTTTYRLYLLTWMMIIQPPPPRGDEELWNCKVVPYRQQRREGKYYPSPQRDFEFSWIEFLIENPKFVACRRLSAGFCVPEESDFMREACLGSRTRRNVLLAYVNCTSFYYTTTIQSADMAKDKTTTTTIIL